MAGYTEVWE